MSSRALTVLAVVLTVAFLADTGYQVYRLTQNQPTTWFGLVLLVPLTFLLKKMNASHQSVSSEQVGRASAQR